MKSKERSNFEYGLRPTFFRTGSTAREKRRGVLFFCFFCLIGLGQAFFWLFANKIKPILAGMPIGMFFIVALAIGQFVLLIVLYLLEPSKGEK